MSVVPATSVAAWGRTRAGWLACVVIAVNLALVALFVAVRVAMLADLPWPVRPLGYMLRDLAQWVVAIELGLAALFFLLRLRVHCSPATLAVTLAMTGLAIMELSGLHHGLEERLVHHLATDGPHGLWAGKLAKLAVYAAIALLALAAGLFAGQFARQADEKVLVGRFFLIILALALGSGATDTFAGLVKPFLHGGTGTLVLLEMAGELAAAAFAVWLAADLPEKGAATQRLLPPLPAWRWLSGKGWTTGKQRPLPGMLDPRHDAG